MHFFVTEENYEPYTPYLQDRYLKEVFAETKILNGLGDPEQWYSLLNDPAKYQAIKDRIEVEFVARNKTFFTPEEPVALDLEVKNVRTLIVKVFEINTLNFYRDKLEEINTNVDLDGLVASEEKSHTYEEPPARRVRRHFEFPALNRRGVYVIDFIGNGKSSRALVRKGQLRFLERRTAAGHRFTVLDEANRHLTNATIWLAGQEYPADPSGAILIPYSHRPSRQSILLCLGDFATLAGFQHRGEDYVLTAGFHVERESLLKGAKARVLLRPALTIHGVPLALSLLENPSLLITSTDLHDVESSREIKGLALSAEQETVHEFQVPHNVRKLEFTLKGQVQNLSQNQKIGLAANHTFALNEIDTTSRIDDLHLSRVQGGYALRLLGKTGEPKADRPVKLSLKPRDFRFHVETVVQTDAAGRIDLGELRDIVSIHAARGEGVSQTWTLPSDRHTYPRVVHARAGEDIVVPYVGRATEASPALFSLLAKRGGAYVQDHFQAISVKDGFVEIKDLPPGEYDLFLKESGTAIALAVAEGEARGGYLLGENRLLEVRNPAPLQIAAITANDNEVLISLAHASPFTRVHVAATRFLPAFSMFDALAVPPLPEPEQTLLTKPDSAYLSGRDIGDEYRYILDRKYAVKFPGNMLTRPALLLNPRAVRETETAREVLQAGQPLQRVRSLESRPQVVAPAAMALSEEAAQAPSANLDFLPEPAVLLVNLRPDQDGLLTIPRRDLGAGRHLHVVALNPDNVSYRQLVLPELERAPRDLRLAAGLDNAKHLSQQNQVSVLTAGQSLTLPDLATARLEAYDSVAKLYRLYSTLSKDATLAEFGFVQEWPKLTPEEKRAKYSKYACHELSFFLSKKDPGFFENVIVPHLRNKKAKTFLDHWLLGEDLKAYLNPWAYGQLNVVERILLAQRVEGEGPVAARHLQDLLDLLPPNLERTNELFLTALEGSALETGDALGLREAGQKARAAQPPEGKVLTLTPPPAALAAAPAPAAPAEVAADVRLAQERPEVEAVAKAAAGSRALGRPAVAPAAPGRAGRMVFAGESDEDKAKRLAEDAARRGAVRQLYRPMEKTQEWAENNYYNQPLERQNASLVAVNAFWRDYARHAGAGPFLSPNMAEASRSFTEMMFALAVLDLPFDPEPVQTASDGPRLTLTAKSPLIVFHQEVKESTVAKDGPPLLVTQNFFRASDRYQFENGERRDKYVKDEFLIQVVYGCKVVLTSSSPAPLKLEVLLQIPRGAMPVASGFETRSEPIALEPYSTANLEYFFYFPAPGEFPHYPAQVSRHGQLLASAPAATCKVLPAPAQADTTSWDYLSQQGTAEAVLAFLNQDNPHRLKLERLAWRLRDLGFFRAVTETLSRRHAYDHTLWSYGLHHNEPAAIREYLQHANDFLNKCGGYLDCPLVTIDPVVRHSYEHLEYSPLVHARAHQVGKRRQIFNERLAAQYHALLKVLSYRPKLDDADNLSVTFYLLLQDRITEAQRYFARVDPRRLATRLQYDYLRAYLDFFTPDRKLARDLAEPYRDYPVDRWRNLFREVLAQLDEIEGKGPAVVDQESREQAQTKLAATEGAFDFTVEARRVTVHYQNLTAAQVHYYLMDIELLFSRNPFVQQNAGQFALVRPNRTDVLELPAGANAFAFDLPEEFRSANLMVEIAAGGRRKSQPYFANSLALQLLENYGQLRLTHQNTGAPLPQVYVKVYARTPAGDIRFYKDGYTDFRGRFDYTSLNTGDLEAVEKLSLLVISDTDGALIREANPPKR
jgi:hypothetical protein